jgi:uncharacterized protein (TIGR02246 family)
MKMFDQRAVWGVLAAVVMTAGLLSVNGHLASAQSGGKPGAEKAPAKSVESDPRAADRAGIRKTMDSFADAFQKGDAIGAAAYLTSEAELTPDDGTSVKGRENIQKAFASHFAKSERSRMSLEVQSLDFPSRDTAIEEGVITTTTKGSDADSTKNQYQILYVREDGKWYLASIREQAIEKPELEDLAWLIGTWSAKRPEAEIQTTYEWFGNKTFILARFTAREKDTTITGMQLIGTDPSTNSLRTWTFEVDGGFGEGTCARDGKQWIFETQTALTDARTMSASNILVRIDDNSFTWQPVNLNIDGEEVGNLPPVKVVRVEAKK